MTDGRRDMKWLVVIPLVVVGLGACGSESGGERRDLMADREDTRVHVELSEPELMVAFDAGGSTAVDCIWESGKADLVSFECDDGEIWAATQQTVELFPDGSVEVHEPEPPEEQDVCSG